MFPSSSFSRRFEVRSRGPAAAAAALIRRGVVVVARSMSSLAAPDGHDAESSGGVVGALALARQHDVGAAWWDRGKDWSWARAMGSDVDDNTRVAFHLPLFGRAFESNPEENPLAGVFGGPEEMIGGLMGLYERFFDAQERGDDRTCLETATTIDRFGLMTGDGVVTCRARLFLAETHVRLHDLVAAERRAREAEALASLEEVPMRIISEDLGSGDDDVAPGLWHPQSSCPRLVAACLHADALKLRGVIRGKALDDPGAVRWYERSLQIYKHVPGEELNCTALLMNIGNRLTHNCLYTEAQAKYDAVREALAKCAQEGDESDETFTNRMEQFFFDLDQNEGHLLMIQGNHAEAIAKFRAALKRHHDKPAGRPRSQVRGLGVSFVRWVAIGQLTFPSAPTLEQSQIMHVLRLLLSCVPDEEQREVLEQYNACAVAATAEGATGARAVEPDTICGVCLDPLMDDAGPFKRCVLTTCGHGVHRECLSASRDPTTGLGKCPVCREQLNVHLAPIVISGDGGAQLVG